MPDGPQVGVYGRMVEGDSSPVKQMRPAAIAQPAIRKASLHGRMTSPTAGAQRRQCPGDANGFWQRQSQYLLL